MTEAWTKGLEGPGPQLRGAAPAIPEDGQSEKQAALVRKLPCLGHSVHPPPQKGETSLPPGASLWEGNRG